MSQLTVTLVQVDLAWKAPEANFSRIEKLLESTKDTDLIVLPEMFATGFIMDPAKTRLAQEEALGFMKKLAESKDAMVCGSLAIEDLGNFYNRFYAVDRQGIQAVYDKRHLFKLAGEHECYEAGGQTINFSSKGFVIRPIVCYDLRFPVWIRQNLPYDLLLCVANWPAPRIQAWDTLLAARAIENQCYALGVNRVGVDPNNNDYLGHSSVYDALGNQLVLSLKEEAISITLDRLNINAVRKKVPYLEDRDTFEIK